MKKIKKFIAYFILAIIVIPIGIICYMSFILPDAGDPENIKVEITPERLERGKYLANSVYICMDCHSKRDWNKFSGPFVKNSIGQGGEEFSQKEGLPGRYFSKNITPFSILTWTDGEILRAITCGVNNKGKALFPIMPYPNYGKLDREDFYAIIAFVRTLVAIDNKVPESESDFPMNFIINTIPEKAVYSRIPDKNSVVAYGKYLFMAASCFECHTQIDKGKSLPGLELAGGHKFQLKTGGIVVSANITPDKESGIGNWTEEAFLNRFKVYADSTYKPITVEKGDFNSVMPWMMFGAMKSDDLIAIFAYLKTVIPVKNSVIRFIPE